MEPHRHACTIPLNTGAYYDIENTIYPSINSLEKGEWKENHEDEDTRPLQKELQSDDQNTNTHKYLKILDSWSQQRKGDTNQDNSATTIPIHDYSQHNPQQQYHRTVSHRNKKSRKSRLWLSTWPHPLTEAHSLKESQDRAAANLPGSQKHSNANSHLTVTEKHENEDVLFRVLGDMELSQMN